jgi:glycosyltransferase involved in cell wall biosynthesis
MNRNDRPANVAILTPALARFDPAYSISHVILDQTRCLLRAGHEVSLFVAEASSGDIPEGSTLKPFLPGPNYHARILKMLEQELSGFDVVFTHDWIRHPELRPYLAALKEYAKQEKALRWYHWIHSVPTFKETWWDMSDLPLNHWFVYPNATDASAAAERFNIDLGRTVVIPDIADLRLLCKFDAGLMELIDELPGLISADFVQVYPAAADRLKDKGLDKLIYMFAAIKNLGQSVCCLVVDSWSVKHGKEGLKSYRDQARACGLLKTEFAFISDHIKGFRALERHRLMNLLQLSNVCIFPTRGEAFGLILPETMLASGAYPVCNGSLPMMEEICGFKGLYPEFGSCERSAPLADTKEFYEQEAALVVREVKGDQAVAGRDVARQYYNMDAVYRNYYARILGG